MRLDLDTQQESVETIVHLAQDHIALHRRRILNHVEAVINAGCWLLFAGAEWSCVLRSLNLYNNTYFLNI